MTKQTLSFRPTSREQKMLTIYGLPGYLYQEREVHLGRLSNYTSTAEGLKPLAVKRTEQIADIEEVLAAPAGDPYTLCISSDPNDLAAKTLAAIVMLQALRQRLPSAWHTILGGYRDEARDNPRDFNTAELMVFSNITVDSTDLKIEKLRDLLEVYSNRPRIVTLTGGDPIAFFNSIGSPLSYSLWLRSERTQRVLGS